MAINYECPKCGSTEFALEYDPEYKEEILVIVICRNCDEWIGDIIPQ
jgi:uncharacterized Zn finger protein